MSDLSVTSLGYNQALTNATSSTSTSSTSLDSTDFLELLLVQLENQDPTDPTDTTQLTDQLCQFSQVEQQQLTNAYLYDLIGYQNALMNAQATSLLGNDVLVQGNGCSVSNGESNELIFDLQEDAESVTISIYDESGELVKEIQLGEMTKGKHELDWEATDNDGNILPDGTYTFEVNAENSEGESFEGITFSAYTVVGVEVRDGALTLTTDEGSQILYSDVMAVWKS